MRRTGATLLGIIAVAWIGAAAAEPPPVDVQHFQPHPDRTGWYATHSAEALGLWHPAFGLWTHYAHKPLVHYVDGEAREAIVSDLLTMDVQAALGFGFADIAVDVPVHLLVQGEGLPTWSDAGKSTQLGDIRIAGKFQIVDPVEHPYGFGLGISLPFTVPSGNEAEYVGLETVAFSPRLLLTGYRAPVRVGGNLGYRLTRATELDDLTDGQAFLFAAAFGISPHPVVEISGEIYGDIRSHPLDNPRNNPVEWLAGLTIRPHEAIVISVAGGSGVDRGFGTPYARAVFGFHVTPIPSKDTDGDGLVDRKDECPEDPEDLDGYEDEDGCPELDNDLDGILDADDACVNEPENRNGWEDTDGCPEEIPDTDGDGLLDDVDQCVPDPEDPDGYQDQDGCPDPDNDGDGILDAADQCPNSPENVNGYEDEDGCPEDIPDTDGDGLVDTEDRCPLEPEDADGFEDEDGCPDPDNDGDRILDVDDACPMEPEVINGLDDEDGCPDQGRVVLEKEEIKILEKVLFDTGKSTIKDVSKPLLDEVAAVLQAVPAIKRVEVQGHTDERGSDSMNMKLSQARANSVKVYLVSKGIGAGRLIPVGYGETDPLDPASNDEAWEKNRRVQFVILEQEATIERIVPVDPGAGTTPAPAPAPGADQPAPQPEGTTE